MRSVCMCVQVQVEDGWHQLRVLSPPDVQALPYGCSFLDTCLFKEKCIETVIIMLRMGIIIGVVSCTGRSLCSDHRFMKTESYIGTAWPFLRDSLIQFLGSGVRLSRTSWLVTGMNHIYNEPAAADYCTAVPDGSTTFAPKA